MDLVIIEGAGKKETIKKYLGSGYEVFATKGHVRDLPQKSLAVDIKNNFAPKYVIMPDKKQIVADLKAKAEKAKKIYLATDPDREGEAISWHLSHILNIEDGRQCRIVFNEISKKAIEKALEKPRAIDQNLVDAQQARRVLDRIVGYQLSPYLSRKIARKRLSAGRVQSVALKLVCDREAEITAFKPVESYLVAATLKKGMGEAAEFAATLYSKNGAKFKPKNKEEADVVLADLKGAQFSVTNIKESITKSSAAPPFITSTLQQEALNKLSMSLKRTGLAAQALYEGVNIKGEGKTALVTYIRTDSVRVSPDAQALARAYIEKRYGNEFVPEKPNFFKSKKNTQDAHEAIRPVHLELTPESVKDSLEPDQYRLYKLIFERFIASQMSEAKYNSVAAMIKAGEYEFKANGRTLLFAGWTAAYSYGEQNETSGAQNTSNEAAAKEKVADNENDDESDGEGELNKNAKLPPLAVGDNLTAKKVTAVQKFTKPPARYTDASLVKALEEKGVGRPATYAPTIATIYARLYVEKLEKHIKPTELGQTVCDVLVKNFPDLISVSFTADMEDRLDEIEEGGKKWQKEIEDFYKTFEEDLKKAGEDTEKIRLEPELTDEKCELCGKPMAVRHGKFGKFLGCSGYPDCKNIKKIERIVGSCPQCGDEHQGNVVQRKSKKGTLFYGCSRWPKCDFVSWNIPLKENCPKCKCYLELKKTKDGDIKICSSKACDYKLLAKKEEEGEK